MVSILLLTAGCGSLPRDPEHTLERARNGRVRVGLVENPTWVIRTQSEPAGAEVELARAFAGSIGAQPQWFWGGEQEHMQALQRFELDLVIGGLDDRNPWLKKVGVTRPYFEDRVLVGAAPGAAFPDTLKNLAVAAEAGDEVAGLLRKKDARPLRVGQVDGSHGPIAAPDWELERLGFVPTRFELLKRKHVIATPPGENAWLQRLGDFLYDRRSEIRGLLQAQEVR